MVLLSKYIRLSTSRNTANLYETHNYDIRKTISANRGMQRKRNDNRCDFSRGKLAPKLDSIWKPGEKGANTRLDTFLTSGYKVMLKIDLIYQKHPCSHLILGLERFRLEKLQNLFKMIIVRTVRSFTKNSCGNFRTTYYFIPYLLDNLRRSLTLSVGK